MSTADEVNKHLKPRHARKYSRQVDSIINRLHEDEQILLGTLVAVYAQGPELEGVGVLTDSRLVVALTGNNGDKWDAFNYNEVDVEWDKTSATIEPRGLMLSFLFNKEFSHHFADKVRAAGGRTLNI